MLLRGPAAGEMASGPHDQRAVTATGISGVDRSKFPPDGAAEGFRVPIGSRSCHWVEFVLCVWPERPPAEELRQVFAGVRSGPPVSKSLSHLQRSRVVSREEPAPPVFRHAALSALPVE